MTKKLLISILLVAALLTPQTAYGKTVCTQAYGQPVRCFEEEEQVLGVHTPVEAGIFDNPLSLAVSLLLISLGFTYLSRKAKTPSLS